MKPLVCFFIVCVAFEKLGTCVLYLSVLCFVPCFFILYTVSGVLFTVYCLGNLVFVCIPSLLWVVFTVLGLFPCMCFSCVNKTLLLGILIFFYPYYFVFAPSPFLLTDFVSNSTPWEVSYNTAFDPIGGKCLL